MVGVRRSGGLAFPARAYIGVTDNAFPGVTGTEEQRDDGLGRHRIEFAAGEAEATVTVTVPMLPALHVTGERTLTLKLSNAGNAVIDAAVATGTIVRQSELPKAWLARFGRTASDHAAQVIGRRLEANARETHVTVVGRRVDGLQTAAGPRGARVQGPESRASRGLPRFFPASG